jgi:D-alanyl-D-alanine dipeptidase
MDERAVVLADRRVRSMPVRECGDSLVRLDELGPTVRLDDRESPTNRWYGLIRAEVAGRLQAAAEQLPSDLVLLVVEGYRAPAEQQRRYLWYRDRIARENPGAMPDWIDLQAGQFVAPIETAPHCTGGAVDLTLASTDGIELDLGGALNAHRHGDEASCITRAAGLSSAAQHNRQILTAALTTAGLVNYPFEWWHWSYGDKYWAYQTGAAEAKYGPHSVPS